MMKGIEEQVEDIAKQQLTEAKVKHFAKNESVNTEIDEALKLAKSKNGGQGGNLPDIKVLLSTKDFPNIPVLIEVKGTKGALVKKDASGLIANVTAKGESDWKTIKKYAVNGAVHYAEAVLQLAKSYDRAFAIGINGVLVNGEISLELGVYYLSKDNALVPKEVGTYSDLTFLAKAHLPELCEKIDLLKLTPREQEERDRDFESRIEAILQRLNQRMHDELNIKDTERVQLVCGMIMAALGVESDDGSYKVLPLEVTELKGETGAKNNDGQKILDKISDFLAEKKLPEQKKETIQNIYKGIFTNKTNYTPKNGESPVHVVYVAIHDDLMPVFRSARHLDFAGRLFNVLNSWIALRPGDDKNDVVLTPRYVCRLMAKLCRVNMDKLRLGLCRRKRGFSRDGAWSHAGGCRHADQESRETGGEKRPHQIRAAPRRRNSAGHLCARRPQHDSYG